MRLSTHNYKFFHFYKYVTHVLGYLYNNISEAFSFFFCVKISLSLHTGNTYNTKSFM